MGEEETVWWMGKKTKEREEIENGYDSGLVRDEEN